KITSLIIQYPYNHIEIGLAHNDLVIDSIQEDKHSISRRLIPDIDALLQRNNLTLSGIDYITINCGPGPLNTLRGILATANAIHFTKQIPLVSLDALELLESEQTAGYTTIPLLQAFSKHVYLRYKQKNYDIAFDMITSMLQPDEPYYFVGNGAIIHKELLQIQFPKSLCAQAISFPSLEQCAQAGWKKYQTQAFVTEFSPIYV
ncbi:hypothetical protein EBQ93_00270, partial [bacterium]|nr:hypothetical protein [bacterium]